MLLDAAADAADAAAAADGSTLGYLLPSCHRLLRALLWKYFSGI